MENIIETKNLTHDYNGRGIYDVSLYVKKGEVLGFLGPNGAGKSTTIRHLMGYIKPEDGNAYILGKETFSNYNTINEHIGYLPGEVNFIKGIKAKDMINYIYKLRKVKDRTFLDYLLSIFTIDLNSSTKEMSVGEKRKLAIIIAFLSDPDILVLDEPSSGLDPLMQEKFIEFILEEKKRGKTIILSSHMFHEVEALCDRIVIIKDGRIIKELTKDEIHIVRSKTFELTFKNKEESLKYITLNKHLNLKEINNKPVVKLSINDNDIDQMFLSLKGYDIVNLYERVFNFEEYFLNFYRSDRNFGGL